MKTTFSLKLLDPPYYTNICAHLLFVFKIKIILLLFVLNPHLHGSHIYLLGEKSPLMVRIRTQCRTAGNRANILATPHLIIFVQCWTGS
jgi:hypothetical protein